MSNPGTRYNVVVRAVSYDLHWDADTETLNRTKKEREPYELTVFAPSPAEAAEQAQDKVIYEYAPDMLYVESVAALG